MTFQTAASQSNAAESTLDAKAQPSTAIDFDSDEPLQCPLRQPGDDGVVCEACQ